MALSWHKGSCHIAYWNKAVAVNEWKPNKEYKPGDIVYTNAKEYGYGWYQSFTSWSMCMFKHTSNESNKPQPLETFSDLIADIVVDIEILLYEYFKGFTKSIASILIDYCYKQNKYWWNGCIAWRLLDPHASNSCGNLVSGINSQQCVQCGLFDFNKFKLTAASNLKVGMWVLASFGLDGIPHKITHISAGRIKFLALNGKSSPEICGGSETQYHALDVDTLDVKTQNKIRMECEKFNSSNNFGAIIKISKGSNLIERINNRILMNEDKNEIIMNEKSVYFDIKVLNKPTQKKIAVSNLMKRNFNEDMNDLIDACFGINKQQFEENMNIKLGNNICVWCLYQNYDLNQNLLCGLVWRKVGVVSSKLKMFEIIFLSTFENVRFQKYGQLMHKKIEIFCRQNCIDIMAVAAVPKHGISFWKSNGFKEYVMSDGNIVESEKKKEKKGWDWYRRNNCKIDEKTIAQYLKSNMLVFCDTPLYAKLVL
eukprot:443784_1